jgi:hypothetical protein
MVSNGDEKNKYEFFVETSQGKRVFLKIDVINCFSG